ncbi:aminotransferase class III-fold pyridoxal phosphate-dependent enzyme, partial [Chitinophaga sp.]|uniref:aminotransferase class III-fold pyridoxal phosphate-dependent enzyme n=1 Tax=Chitinophaga sp. TaxID=1869181 RepID=UPI002F92E796
AALAVLETIQAEKLVENAATVGNYLMENLRTFDKVKEVRGRGLMIGIDLPEELSQVRKELLHTHKIFTGEAKPNVIRLLPSLALTQAHADQFLEAFGKALNK